MPATFISIFTMHKVCFIQVSLPKKDFFFPKGNLNPIFNL